jgi:hypothetical protein
MLTLLSLGELRPRASHTYVVTHGLGGIHERFFELAQAIHRVEPAANVLVVDWTPGAVRHMTVGSMRFLDPLAVARRIDPTGDALGDVLATLHRRRLFKPTEATFIGESFGNYVNNRAARHLRRARLGKVKRALLLNPATQKGGYGVPVVTRNYTQSMAFVTCSCFDTQQQIADRQVQLRPKTADPIRQHIYGLRWLGRRTQTGKEIGSLFVSCHTSH